MFGWFKGTQEVRKESNNIIKPVCKHDNWRIHGSTTIGFAACLDCGKQIPLDDAFNMLHDKMLKAIDKVEKKSSRLADIIDEINKRKE